MIYRLCGGTFFTLMCNARKDKPSHSEMYSGISSGISEPELLAALTKIADSTIDATGYSSNQGAKDAAGKYKRCEGYGGDYYRLGKKKIKNILDSKVKYSYSRALSAMDACIEHFIETKTTRKKDECLVKALVEILAQDTFISDEQQFYVIEDGRTMTKAEICQAETLCLQSFLLGIWHYVVTLVNNKVGKQTYDEWCPSQGGATREYIADIGENSKRKLNLTYIDMIEMSNNDALDIGEEKTYQDFTSTFEDDDPDTQDKTFAEAKCLFQTIINPIVVNQNGTQNIYINHLDTLNL